ncbi:MAG: ABC transporter permease [Streptosporangiaceae bacterium]|jgi:ABC-2 type transport system permease protein
MSVTTAPPPAAAHGSALGRLTLIELKLFTRGRAAVGMLLTVAVPLLLLIIFGSIRSFNRPVKVYGGLTVLDVYVPILLALSVALLSLLTIPTVLAGYREIGVLRRLQTTPAGPIRVLTAQLVVKLGAAAVTVILILAVARIGYGVTWPGQLAGFAVAGLLTAAALMAIGLFIAAVAPTCNIARGIGAIVFYPMMFFAGLWLPIPNMPRVLQHISHATPLGAAVPALQNATLGHWPTSLQLLTLAAYAVAFGLAAAKLFRWE